MTFIVELDIGIPFHLLMLDRSDPQIQLGVVCRSLVELECEHKGKPESTFYSGPNIRAGTFPCAFDASRKKMLWFFFVATVMGDQELVQSPRSSCRQGCTIQLIRLLPAHVILLCIQRVCCTADSIWYILLNLSMVKLSR